MNDKQDKPAKIGILTVSDRASRGEYEDLGGPAIADYLNEVLDSSWETVPRVIPDTRSTICLLYTSPSPRDRG